MRRSHAQELAILELFCSAVDVADHSPSEWMGGVYILIRRKTIVYVGQSVNVRARVRQHACSVSFDRAIWFAVHSRHLDAFESALIVHIKPEHNAIRRNRKPAEFSAEEIISAMGFSVEAA